MILFVVRHADAGEREDWDGDDSLRPVSKKGARQTAALTEFLAGERITKIVSSPALRCQQSVEELSEKVGLPIESSEAIAEGAPLEDTLALIDKLAEDTPVLCTHGDVIGNLLWHFERAGLDIGEGRMQKASVWVFRMEDGAAVDAVYVPPPAK